MLENFKIGMEKAGRLVIPKEIRNQLKIEEDTKFNIRQESDYLYFDIISYKAAIDSFGRVLIPIKLRNKYNLIDETLLSSTTNGFKIKNNKSKHQCLIDKLVFLEDNYSFKFILTNDCSLIYKNKDYNTLTSNKIIEIHNFLSNNRNLYETLQIDTSDETLHLFIIYNDDNKKLLSLIKRLL